MANVTSNYRPIQRLNGRVIYVRKKSNTGPVFKPEDVKINEGSVLKDGMDPYNGASSFVVSIILLLVLSTFTCLFK